MTSFNSKKKREAVYIIDSTISKSKNPCVCFSGGKNSLVLLHLIKIRHPGFITVIHIDTGIEFPAIHSYIQKMKKLWRFNLFIEKSTNQNKEIAENKRYCCEHLKCKPLMQFIRKFNIDCIFVGDTSESDNIISNLLRSYPEFKPIVVQPLISFNDTDIWDYIGVYNLPYCSLYEEGYATLDCKPCSHVMQSQQINKSNHDDEKIIKEKLKKLGYL